MIRIENLTKHQVNLLDTMWSFHTEEQYFDWYESLKEGDRKMADVLIKLMMHELIDESMQNEFSEAKQVLRKFML